MTHNQTPDDASPNDALPSAASGRRAATAPVAAAGESTQLLPPAARRALAEAEERRRATEVQNGAAHQPVELGGRAGPDPVRYGDWEKGGIASDF